MRMCKTSWMTVRLHMGDYRYMIAHKLNSETLPTIVGLMALYMSHVDFEWIFQCKLLQLFSKTTTCYFEAWKPIAT